MSRVRTVSRVIQDLGKLVEELDTESLGPTLDKLQGLMGGMTSFYEAEDVNTIMQMADKLRQPGATPAQVREFLETLGVVENELRNDGRKKSARALSEMAQELIAISGIGQPAPTEVMPGGGGAPMGGAPMGAPEGGEEGEMDADHEPEGDEEENAEDEFGEDEDDDEDKDAEDDDDGAESDEPDGDEEGGEADADHDEPDGDEPEGGAEPEMGGHASPAAMMGGGGGPPTPPPAVMSGAGEGSVNATKTGMATYPKVAGQVGKIDVTVGAVEAGTPKMGQGSVPPIGGSMGAGAPPAGGKPPLKGGKPPMKGEKKPLGKKPPFGKKDDEKPMESRAVRIARLLGENKGTRRPAR